jgi:hypothetical protein
MSWDKIKRIIWFFRYVLHVEGLDSIDVGFLKVKNKEVRVAFPKEKIDDLYQKLGFYANAIKYLVQPPLE